MVHIEREFYSQIGLVTLIGLATMNAILIVEFAKDEFEKGKPLAEAAMAGASLQVNRLSRDGTTPIPATALPSQNRDFGSAALQLLSFEIDIWGRLRRATEAARANLLSAEENRKVVAVTLISDVATAYFTLRELDYAPEISRRTLQTREDSLALTQSRQTGGVSTLFDLR